ncbi:hypothetical protein SALBM217S_01768 [Streptomyces griseoloalbus]
MRSARARAAASLVSADRSRSTRSAVMVWLIAGSFARVSPVWPVRRGRRGWGREGDGGAGTRSCGRSLERPVDGDAGGDGHGGGVEVAGGRRERCRGGVRPRRRGRRRTRRGAGRRRRGWRGRRGRPPRAVPRRPSCVADGDEGAAHGLSELLGVGFDDVGVFGEGGAQGGARGVEGDAQAGGVDAGDEFGVPGGGEAAGEAAAADDPVAPAAWRRTVSRRCSCSAGVRSGPGALIFVRERRRPRRGQCWSGWRRRPGRGRPRCPARRGGRLRGRRGRRRAAGRRRCGSAAAATARETLTPLPPGSTRSPVARTTSPRSRDGTS